MRADAIGPAHSREPISGAVRQPLSGAASRQQGRRYRTHLGAAAAGAEHVAHINEFEDFRLDRVRSGSQHLGPEFDPFGVDRDQGFGALLADVHQCGIDDLAPGQGQTGITEGGAQAQALRGSIAMPAGTESSRAIGSGDFTGRRSGREETTNQTGLRTPKTVGQKKWCGRKDSNLHGCYPTATSTLRVYQFRHDRMS